MGLFFCHQESQILLFFFFLRLSECAKYLKYALRLSECIKYLKYVTWVRGERSEPIGGAKPPTYPQVIHKVIHKPNENDSHLHMGRRFYHKKQQITRKIIYRFYILFRLTSLFFYDSDFFAKTPGNLHLKFAKFNVRICLCQGNFAPGHFGD